MQRYKFDSAKYTKRDLHSIATKMFRQLREEAGLSMYEVGEELGISYNTLGAYERGDRVCHLDAAEKILNFYGYTLTVSKLEPS